LSDVAFFFNSGMMKCFGVTFMVFFDTSKRSQTWFPNICRYSKRSQTWFPKMCRYSKRSQTWLPKICRHSKVQALDFFFRGHETSSQRTSPKHPPDLCSQKSSTQSWALFLTFQTVQSFPSGVCQTISKHTKPDSSRICRIS